MSVTFKGALGVVLAVRLAVAAAGGGGAAPVPAPAVYSSDGAVAVRSSVARAAYRSPVLLFVDRVRAEAQRVTRLRLGSAVCPLEVTVGERSDGHTRVYATRVRDGGGGLSERIELADPEAADLGQFRRAICVALFRAWMVEAGGGRERPMGDLPLWLIDGVVRRLDREGRQADVDRALLLWSRACLPVAAELYAFDSVAARREPAVAAVLAGRLLEKRPEGNPFEALLRAGATGSVWRVEQVARLLTGTEDLGVFDEATDGWLVEAGRQVVQPGVTTAGVARRFRQGLLLYPADYGKSMDQRKAWLSLQEAAALADLPEVRRGARDRALGVRAWAMGRDGTFLAVTEAYAIFLEALARGTKPGELTRLLLEAECLRGDLERRVATGPLAQGGLSGG